MGESQSRSFLLTGVLFHAVILCCLLKEGRRRVPVGSSTSQPKLRGRDLASWVSPDPQPRGDQGWQRASPKVHIQITNNCRALGKWPALPVPWFPNLENGSDRGTQMPALSCQSG